MASAWTGQLPLYYSFDDRVEVLGYRIEQSGKFSGFFQLREGDASISDNANDDHLPAYFQQRAVKLQVVRYDRSNLQDACAYAAVFGLGGLKVDQYLKVLKKQEKLYTNIMQEPPGTVDDLLSFFAGPFIQGAPRNECLNPSCIGRIMGVRLRAFCLVPNEPVPGVMLFGQWGGDVQIIFEVCPACGTIHASNQCS